MKLACPYKNISGGPRYTYNLFPLNLICLTETFVYKVLSRVHFLLPSLVVGILFLVVGILFFISKN